MGRWFRFLIAILVGIGLGLAYGWFVSPVRYVDTSPDTLRIDYRTDYILMVAEAYANDGDLAMAMRRLAMLGNQPPNTMVLQAVEFAREQGYSETDLRRMQDLWSALQAAIQPQGGITP